MTDVFLRKIWKLIEGLALWCLALLFRVLHKELTEGQKTAFMQFVKFGTVGVSNTIVSYVIYLVTLWTLEKANLVPDYDYVISNVVAWLLSVLWSFYWNNKYVFRKKEGEERSLLYTLFKTYCSYAFTGLFLNNVLSVVLVQAFHISKVIVPILTLFISVPINFFMNKLWAFRSRG